MNKPIAEKKRFKIDPFLVTILLGMMAVSLVAIYYASEYVNYSTMSLVKKQLMWYVIGSLILIGLVYIGIDSLFKLARVSYFILLILLSGLVVVKYTGFLRNSSIISRFISPINGAWAWYQIPGIGSFQPSEFMKIVLLFVIAGVIHRHNLRKTVDSYASDMVLFGKVGAWVLPPLFLNILQPDTGIPMIVLFSMVVMLYSANTKRLWTILLVGSLIVLYFGIIYIYYNHPSILSNVMGGSYRLGRFYGWLDYQKYAQLYGYQLNNSLINLGIGGLKGVGNIALRMHTAEGQTDFIFSVFGSKFGFVGSSTIIALCVALNVRLMMIAVKSNDLKAKYLISGLSAIFMVQQIINIAMMVGLLPITGITLPLISYGGSSLVSYMIGLAYPFLIYSKYKTQPLYQNKTS